MTSAPRITAIVPALDEEKAIPATLSRLKECGFEIIVVDGGSRDRTAMIAAQNGARVLSSPPGRARQMNAGAAAASGDIFFFVHADTLPVAEAGGIIIKTLHRPDAAAGAFRLNIVSRHPFLRLISALANFRSSLFGLPYGDQGIFLTREVFEKLNGFKDIPLMEDIDLVRRIRPLGKVVLAPAPIYTSARRWEQKGAFRNSLQNQVRLWRYYRGASPETLLKSYRDVR